MNKEALGLEPSTHAGLFFLSSSSTKLKEYTPCNKIGHRVHLQRQSGMRILTQTNERSEKKKLKLRQSNLLVGMIIRQHMLVTLVSVILIGKRCIVIQRDGQKLKT